MEVVPPDRHCEIFKATKRASTLPSEAGEERDSTEMEKLREVLGLGVQLSGKGGCFPFIRSLVQPPAPTKINGTMMP